MRHLREDNHVRSNMGRGFAVLLVCAAAFVSVIAPAQNTAQSYNSQAFNKGVELYRAGMYDSALGEFSKAGGEKGEGYKVLCKIKLKSPNLSGTVKEYAAKYPSSSLMPLMKFRLAVADFDNDNFGASMKILDDLDPQMLEKTDREEYFFRKGYCQMRTGDYTSATRTFSGIVSSPEKSAYAMPANYYLGYIRYVGKDFERAIPYFEKALQDRRFTALCKYHILDSKFMIKDYDYVTANGPDVYSSADKESKAKVARIISESYYAKGEAHNAQKFFNLYSSGGVTLNRQDNFYSGLISYTLKDYPAAINSFNAVRTVDDSLGQSASYHIGQCYIQLKNKPAAEEAFRNAAYLHFDKSIEEDAFFNYAKLNFDLTGETAKFKEYLGKYDVTITKSDEIYGYIASGSLAKNDYDNAIDALGRIRKPSTADVVNLKKACFFKGAKLLNEGSYSSAAQYLKKGTENEAYNVPLTNLAKFWLSECLFRQGKYEESQKIITELQRNIRFRQSAEYPGSYFNSGYNYFRMKDLDNAIRAFQTYLDFPAQKREFTAEAQTRVADCMFMQRNYAGAAALYDKAGEHSSSGASLYAPLQGAIAHGLIAENAKKISILKEITSDSNRNSEQYTEALYELGRAYVQNSNDVEAAKTYNKLINNPPDSIFYYKALLEMGMICSNRGKYDDAIAYYKRLIDSKSDIPEAQTALSAMENICQSQNRPEEFLEYAQNSAAAASKSPEEREEMLFSTTEQIYMGGKYEAAVKTLASFTERYPNGKRYPQAMFYLAESYKNLDRLEEAAACYKKVMDAPDAGSFAESAALNYAEISYKIENYRDAIKGYEYLEKITKFEETVVKALAGEIRSYFNNREYSSAVSRSEQMLDENSAGQKEKNEALYYKGKSLLALGERNRAMDSFKKIAGDPSTEMGAEAAYLIIKNSFDNGQFANVEKQVFALSKSKTPQTYWLAKSFIILGDSYSEQGKKEQAKATYESIRDNYEAKNDDILNIIKGKLK